MKPILKVDGLRVIHRKTGRSIVRDIEFELHEEEILGVVGESGSGKSITMFSILGILPESLEVSGRIVFEGEELTRADDFEKVRGKKIAMIFQDPLNALNPVMRIKDQLRILSKSHGIPYSDAEAEMYKILERIGIHQQDRVLKSFPHQLSGGMLQRLVIAFVLLLKPRVIIADEPTTSLDVSVQREIVNILKEIRAEYGISIIFITHDLLLAKEVCDEIGIMYSGYIVEKSTRGDIFTRPLHPYTRGLISSVPTVNFKPQLLLYIPGRVPLFSELGEGCPFAERCPIAESICRRSVPALRTIGGSQVRCFLAEKGISF